jgi:hypothetical protein
VILGKSKVRSEKLELFYGKSDQGETAKQTAARESLEETAGLFNFENLDTDASVTSPNGHHTAFIVQVKGDCQTRLFYDNYAQLRKARADPSWLETTDLVRVKIKDLVNNGILTKELSKDFHVVDVHNQPCIILSRDAEFIRSAIDENFIGDHARVRVSELKRTYTDGLHTYTVQ